MCPLTLELAYLRSARSVVTGLTLAIQDLHSEKNRHGLMSPLS